MRLILTITFLVTSSIFSFGQITGGQHIFEFLNVPYNAKQAALGGQNVSSYDEDVNMIYANPALMNQDMVNHIGFNYSAYFNKTNFGSINYSFNEKSTGQWGAGINYISYGTMDRTNEGGEIEGSFTANEIVLYASKAHQIEPFTIGATIKYARSQLAEFAASGLFVDLGGLYKHPVKDFSIGMTMRNLGTVFNYYNEEKEAIPFEVQAGLSYKPEHLPLKFNVTTHHIEQYDIVYDDPNDVEENIFTDEEPVKEEVPTSEKIFRHFTFGGEIILSKSFHVRLGYDRQNRKELKNKDGIGGGAGFSWGFMIRTSKLEVNFGKVYYQLGARPTYISVSSNLNNIFKKKQIEPTDGIGG